MRHDSLIYIYVSPLFSLVTVLRNMYNLCKLHSLICMSSDMCDEKIDCTDLAVGRAQADRKIGQKGISFLKRSVSTVRFLRFVRQANPMELALIFHLKITLTHKIDTSLLSVTGLTFILQIKFYWHFGLWYKSNAVSKHTCADVYQIL